MSIKTQVALNLRSLNAGEKAQRARALVSALTDNPDFPKTYPSLATIAEAAAKLEMAIGEALKARDISLAKTAFQQQAEAELEVLMLALGSFIQAESKGDEAKIKNAGLSLKGTPAPVGLPKMPTGLSTPDSNKQGAILLKWKSVRGGRSYIVRISENISDPAAWVQADVVTKPSCIITGLTTGKQYWLQVAAIGTAGQSDWSKPLQKMVV
jgi:hypothetical protein